MQNTLMKQIKEHPQHLTAKSSISGIKIEALRIGGKDGYLAMSPRYRPACTCSNRPGAVRCARHGYLVPGERMKKRQARQEILRRALTPPRRLGLRWLNFRPTPSRLSNMSMA